MVECTPEKFFTITAAESAQKLASDINHGLNREEIEARSEKYGRNELVGKKPKTKLAMFIEQFKSFMILVLIVAAVVSALLGEGTDSIIIFAIVILNAIMGVVQESKAEDSLRALKNMSAPKAKVIRNGNVQVLDAAELVPGDIVILETGDYVPADMRLIESINLKIQEAALTGESLPVEKDAFYLANAEESLGDRINMGYSGSLVTYGRGRGVVTATGMSTEVGKIAHMLQSEGSTDTPLKRKLEGLGKTLGIAVLAVCAVIFVVGLLYGKDPLEIFLTAVSLAVAAIPEGLPAIATIVLAIGVQRMARRNAIIRTLPAVETLGSASVICSDKTGTLTQNKMTVEQVYYNGFIATMAGAKENRENVDQKLFMYGALLCNDSRYNEEGRLIGDPTETALLVMSNEAGIEKSEADKMLPRVMEVPFDSERKLMTTAHKADEVYRVFTKGGVDELLNITVKIRDNGIDRPITEEDKANILAANKTMAAEALRVLAVAYKDEKELPLPGKESELESGLVFLGMAGMIDPPREEAFKSVKLCKSAGIRPVMITGDHKITAIAIAKKLNIIKDDAEALSGTELDKISDEELAERIESFGVYARVSPEHKVRIVDAWQKNGQIVAMTGDGVNDAPALKRADIGAAMGITGTDVSKEAADMVLTDDNFATIVAAVEEGRRIFDNILKSIQFLLSCNIGEIITLFVATMLNWTAPLLPIHILMVNLVTDSLPALALGLDPAERNIMKRKPKPSKGFFDRGMLWRISYQGVMVGALTLVAFVIGLHDSVMEAQTMAFVVLSFSQLFHAFNVRTKTRSIFSGGIFSNKAFLLSLLISALLILMVICVAPLAAVFHLVFLTPDEWLIVAGLSVAPIVIVEIFKLFKINDF